MPIAPPNIWTLQPGQTLAQNSEGLICLKYIAITPKEFHFFYALSSFQKGTPDAAATSSLESNVKSNSSDRGLLATTVQPLGKLTEYDVGVIHVRRVSYPGQIITLHIRPPRGNTQSWQLSPLKQLAEEPHKDTSRMGIMTDRRELPEVEMYGPVMQEQVAFFREVTPSGQPASDTPPIFLRMDDPIKVSLITQAEYLSLAGPSNAIP